MTLRQKDETMRDPFVILKASVTLRQKHETMRDLFVVLRALVTPVRYLKGVGGSKTKTRDHA